MPEKIALLLPDEEATLLLGALLARSACGVAHPAALLLQGDLGSGKTTLVRGLVGELPGANESEVSSPSFNLVNLYPTTPPVAHFDLYRTPGNTPEEFYDCVEDQHTLIVAEWIDSIPTTDWPQDALYLKWTTVPSGRAVEISAWGKTACDQLAYLAPSLNQWQKGF
jgi:ATPase, YjeE family